MKEVLQFLYLCSILVSGATFLFYSLSPNKYINKNMYIYVNIFYIFFYKYIFTFF